MTDFNIHHDKTMRSIRASAVLTNSYVAGTVIAAGTYSKGSILVDFTLASLTDLRVRVRFTDAETGTPNYYQEIKEELAGGSGTVTCYPKEYKFLPADWGTTATSALIRVPNGSGRIEVAVLGTGTVTSSLCAVNFVAGKEG